MSLVNFNKTLQRLRKTKAFSFADRRLEILDEAAMIKLALVEGYVTEKRPLI
jgi:hypothetical protein